MKIHYSYEVWVGCLTHIDITPACTLHREICFVDKNTFSRQGKTRVFASTVVKFSKLTHIQTTILRPLKIVPHCPQPSAQRGRRGPSLRHCFQVEYIGLIETESSQLPDIDKTVKEIQRNRQDQGYFTFTFIFGYSVRPRESSLYCRFTKSDI